MAAAAQQRHGADRRLRRTAGRPRARRAGDRCGPLPAVLPGRAGAALGLSVSEHPPRCARGLGAPQADPSSRARHAARRVLGYSEERDVDWVAGAFMLMPRAVFEQTGGFDERLFMYGEDMEWCYRIRDHGWRVRFYPQASIVHVDHASSEMRWGEERIALCVQRQRDLYTQREGRLRGAALMSVRLIGAILRSGYYSIRGRLGGPGAARYREMQPYLRTSLRALVSLTFGRR